MRIGIDARMYSSAFTGIGRYVYELTERLFTLGRDHEWVLFMNEPEYSVFQPPAHVKKVLVNARHYSWREQVSFYRILQREQLDLMHFTHFNAPLLYRKPSVVTIHDLTLSYFPGKKMRSPLHRFAYHRVLNSIVGRAKGIIAVSEHTKNDLVKLNHVDPSRVRVIYEAAGKEFLVLAPEVAEVAKKTYTDGKPFILYTGVWRDHKNLTRLIQAFATLCEDKRFHGQLVITGRQDPFYPEISQTIETLGLKNRVVLTGLVPEKDLVALYNAATLYVLPSLYEGFGLAPLEAMACGTPVAASNAACIPEICGEGNALFFDPYDVEAIAQTLEKIWFDPSTQATLRERGLRRVKDFSWDTLAEQTLAFYNQVHATQV